MNVNDNDSHPQKATCTFYIYKNKINAKRLYMNAKSKTIFKKQDNLRHIFIHKKLDTLRYAIFHESFEIGIF